MLGNIYFILKNWKNTRSASRADYAHNVMKKCVRFVRSTCLTLSRKCNHNLLFGSFAKATKMEKLNVKTLSTTKAARGKSSCRRYSTESVFLKLLQKLTGKHLCWSLLLIMLRSYNFTKKELQYICFPVSFAKFLRITFLKNTYRWLVLCGT